MTQLNFKSNVDLRSYLESKKTISFKSEPKAEIIDTQKVDKKPIKKEKWQINLIQIIIPFFIAGIGMVGTGILLSVVQVEMNRFYI